MLLAARDQRSAAGRSRPPLRHRGAVLSAVGLVLLVTGILAADNNLWLTLALCVAGVLVLLLVLRDASGPRNERAGAAAVHRLFRNRTSNLGMVTQNTQWLLLSGVSFVVAAYLQVVRGYDAIQTGVIFTAETGRSARRVAGRRAAGQPVRRNGP